jgi:hypothetical protein
MSGCFSIAQIAKESRPLVVSWPALHRAIAERRHQDVVGLAPVRFVGVGRKQSVAGKGAYPPLDPSHQLVETFLVAEFVHQIGAANDHKGHAHHVEPEDRTEFPGHPHQTLDRRGRIQRKCIAEHRLRRRMRDWAQSVLGRHVAKSDPGVVAAS